MIERLTSETAIRGTLNAFAKSVRRSVARKLAYAGEAAITAQKNAYSYTQRTGNLLSSTAYAVLEGEEQQVQMAGTQSEGVAAAKKLIGVQPKANNKRISLILAAGMNYAAFVSARGYNVLDTARQVATIAANELLKK